MIAPGWIRGGEIGLPPAPPAVRELDDQRLRGAGQRAPVVQRDDLLTLLTGLHSVHRMRSIK